MTRRYRKKTDKEKLRLKADSLWQELIVYRDSGTCRKCGSTQKVVGHHIVSRTREVTRHEPENGIALCFHCHSCGIHHMDFERAKIYNDWLRGHIGHDQYDRLRLWSEQRKKRDDRMAIILLNELIREMKGE